MFFPPPTQSEIEKLLCDRLRQITVEASVRLSTVARSLEGLSHADVERLSSELVKRTVLLEREQIDDKLVAEVIGEERERMKLVEQNMPNGNRTSLKRGRSGFRKRKVR